MKAIQYRSYGDYSENRLVELPRPQLQEGEVLVQMRNLRLEWAININLRKVRMSDSSQIALIRKLYDAMGDVNAFKSLLADDVEWDIAEGFPNGGVYRGLDTTFSGFFPFLADFDEFYAKGGEYFESGARVIVLGHYFGVSKKGRRVQSRFAHFWTIRDGKVVRLQQTADTLLIAQALGK